MAGYQSVAYNQALPSSADFATLEPTNAGALSLSVAGFSAHFHVIPSDLSLLCLLFQGQAPGYCRLTIMTTRV